MALGCGSTNRASHFGRTRKRDFSDAGMLHQQFAAGTIASHDVHYAGRQSGFLADFSEGECSQRRELRWLEHHGVSGGQGGSDFPGQHKQGEIPWNNLPHDAAGRITGKFLVEELCPTRVIVEMPCHQGNINIPALADRLAVVDRLEYRQAAGMFLYQPCQRIEVARPGMRCMRLPFWKRGACGFHRSVHVCRRALRYGSERFSIGGIRRVEILAQGRRLPSSLNEMPETPPVTFQPQKRLFGIFWGRPILHGHQLVGNAHTSILT